MQLYFDLLGVEHIDSNEQKNRIYYLSYATFPICGTSILLVLVAAPAPPE